MLLCSAVNLHSVKIDNDQIYNLGACFPKEGSAPARLQTNRNKQLPVSPAPPCFLAQASQMVTHGRALVRCQLFPILPRRGGKKRGEKGERKERGEVKGTRCGDRERILPLSLPSQWQRGA